ncbi:MAG: DNA-processing protein DprA [Eubacterium sp.]|nr:DNA-processing protein DprA [Eubacterium sp.]
MDVRYWVWLQMCLGEGARFKPIIEEFGSVKELYSKNIIDWKMSPSLTAAQVERLTRFSLSDAEKIILECDRNEWKIICYEDELYPEKLRNIPNPPAVLYIDGEMPRFDAFAVIGIVGTRKASPYAVKAARLMAKGISLCGGIIVSGGALGVDSAAHNGAFDAGAKTYAVLGSGFGTDYLRSNKELRGHISKNGALITEYPPFVKADKTTFPMRNRIISGLSDGILVVEAGVKSGSLITAQHAAEQGRDIFAIPASILDYNFYGTNKLLDDGATAATSPQILLERYAGIYDTLDLSKIKTLRELAESKNSANTKEEQQFTFDNVRHDRALRLQREEKALSLEGDERRVYNALEDELCGIETIIEKTGLESPKALAALTLLEMKGIAESASGKRYKLK